MEPKTKQHIERRSKFRFGIQRELRYKVSEDGTTVAAGTGQTINLGSGGIAFAAQHELKPTAFVELSISWPAQLNNK